MSKIEDLIEKLCPDGVEYKRLSDVCEFHRGTSITSKNSNDGNVPVISGGQKPAFYHNISNRPANTITIAGSGAYAGFVSFWNEPIFCADAFSVDIKNEDILDKRFLYHYLLNNQQEIYNKKTGAGIAHVHGKYIAKFYIPVPPLEVQNEVVHILDNFTELSAEISEELKARQKQYEYYRDNLLKFEDDIPKVKFGDVALIQRGASPRPINEFVTDNDNAVNWIKIGDVESGAKYITNCKEKITIEGSKKSRYVKKGDFILSNSMSFGRPYILKIEGCIHDGWLAISNFQEHYLSDFLYYLLNSGNIQNEFKKKASFGGAVQNLNADIVRGIELPLLPLEEQKKIINILDRFDKLCNDISRGLPAEIEARQKQYEYYRDKLLNFKELKVEN